MTGGNAWVKISQKILIGKSRNEADGTWVASARKGSRLLDCEYY